VKIIGLNCPKIFACLCVFVASSCNDATQAPASYILRNDRVAVHIDLPLEGYRLSRFDWTGKITAVQYKGVYVTGTEDGTSRTQKKIGKGLYNEFGIDSPLGFDEAKVGDYFHKIGIGLLKKTGDTYEFNKQYEIRPADFIVTTSDTEITMKCISEHYNGHAYALTKNITLLESGFVIRYHFQNTGSKPIHTNEYTHNFLAVQDEHIGRGYLLRFPFELKPEVFGAVLNPKGSVEIHTHEIGFQEKPDSDFFFSTLSGGDAVEAKWELHNHTHNIGIKETGSFKTSSITLWGNQYVICPEIFIEITVEPNQSTQWSRTYKFFDLE
jgi:hypothetical protein